MPNNERMWNSNLYVVESCGTCAHSDMCIHRIKGNNTAARELAFGIAPELPEPFKIKVFCSKYQSRSLN